MNKTQNDSTLGAVLPVSIVGVLTTISVVLLITCFNSISSEPAAASPTLGEPIHSLRTSQARELSLVDRVAYQTAIEQVYWRHRIWPKENERPKPPFDEIMSAAQIQQKVERVARDSQLAAGNGQAVTSEQLQAEMERMASHTKQPDLLRELFAALDNDPAVIAECLARPILSERLVGNPPDLNRELELKGKPDSDSTPRVPSNDESNGIYTLPEIEPASTSCTDDSWTTLSVTNVPSARGGHTAVWTGTEMIIWGGNTNGLANTGGRYKPSTDSWLATTITNAPTRRGSHTAIWTGTEMIVWGGVSSVAGLNSGGRYDPNTDTWIATTTNGAPDARWSHTAVWTGSEMIVWGGNGDSNYNSGGRYNPNADSWIVTPTADAPPARTQHTAVWTGSEMIIWGGNVSGNSQSGGKYNPIANNWIATTTNNAPTGRLHHTAIWTGNEMIIWGGSEQNTGGRYNPSTDSWVATTTVGAPSNRSYHSAVWSGGEMIIWGGFYNLTNTAFNSGGRYNPSIDFWVATTANNAPAARYVHSAVWTGSEMMVWGGFTTTSASWLNSGGRYCISAIPQPTASPCPLCPPTPSPTPTPRPPCTPTTFSNSATIAIPSSGTSGISSPYPSNITVSGMTGLIARVTVSLNGLTHEHPKDLDLLLVGPDGQDATIMSDAGGYDPINVNLSLTDDGYFPGTLSLIYPLPNGGPLFSGTYNPVNIEDCDEGGGDSFPAPAPAPSGASALSVFNGTHPNGTWSLYAVDDKDASVGAISGGWAVTITTVCPPPTPTPASAPSPSPTAGPTHFQVDTPALVSAGVPFNFTVTALDRFNDPLPFAGTIHFTSSDSLAVLPADSAPAPTPGGITFSATLNQVVSAQTITATYPGNFHVTGTSNCTSVQNPAPTSTPSPTPVSISGTIAYCSNPSPGPVPGVMLSLTGSVSSSMLSDNFGSYSFGSLPAGGSYTLTPSKASLSPGAAAINTIDLIAVQRYYLGIGLLAGCPLTAADVNGDAVVNTVDVVAIQRFYLKLTSGIANVGKYRFNPAGRSYPSLGSNQPDQNYDSLIFGDVAAPFVAP